MAEGVGGGYPSLCTPHLQSGKKRSESCVRFAGSVQCRLVLGPFWVCEGVVAPVPWLVSREGGCAASPSGSPSD